MISIPPLLQTPIVYYAIILTIAWTFIQAISRISFRSFIPKVGDSMVFIAFLIYVLLAMLLMNVNIYLFPYLHATMLAFTLLSILGSSKVNSRLLFIVTFTVALMPVLVMVSTKHPLPLGDDARFIGFAGTIAENGRWIPFKYEENPYYQFFHLIPVIEYISALIPGFGLENISAYYLLIKLNLYFMYFVSIYLIMKKLTHDNFNSLVAILLLSITPPLALSQVVHQSYAVVLFLITAFLILHNFEAKGEKRVSDILVTLLLLIAGVVAHATYTIMLLVFIVSIIKLKGKQFKNFISVACSFALLISFTYWNYIYVLDELIRPTINAVDRLVDLLTGRVLFTPFQGATQPWYTETSFFVAWALVPAMTTSFVLFDVFKIILRKGNSLENHFKIVSIMGILGLGGTVLNYILRALPTFGGRYFYWLYLLMLPSSAILMTKTSKKIMSLLLSTVLISVVSFYGIQDPTLVANTYGSYIGWADKTTWNISSLLVQNLPQSSYLLVSGDQRITATFFTNCQILNKNVRLPSDRKPSLIIAGSDNVWYLNMNVLKLFIPNILNMTNSNSSENSIIFSTKSFTMYYCGQ